MNPRHKLFSLFKDQLVIDSAIVFFGTTLAGIFNLIYHLVSVRLLTPQDYGTFNALISLVLFTSVAISPLGATLTRFFTEYITKKDFATLTFIFSKLIKRLIIISCLLFLFFSSFSSYLAIFLKTKAIYIVICGAIASLSLFSIFAPSLFQSFQKFKLYSSIAILSSLGKLIFGLIFMFFGLGAQGALLGFFISPLSIIIFAIFLIPAIFKKEIGHINTKDSISTNLIPIYKYFFPVSVIMFSFTLLTNIDVILVKHFFSPLYAGYYSIAQMVGKIILFLPSALAIVIFPKSTEAHFSNGSSLKILYKSLLLASLCCFLFTGFSFLFPELLLRVLAGKINPVTLNLVGLFSLAMSFYALTWIVIHFFLATHNLKIVLPILFIALSETVLIYTWHPTLKVVLYILLIFSMISFFLSFFIIGTTNNRKLR